MPAGVSPGTLSPYGNGLHPISKAAIAWLIFGEVLQGQSILFRLIIVAAIWNWFL